MMNRLVQPWRNALAALGALLLTAMAWRPLGAQESPGGGAPHVGGEASLRIPDLAQVTFASFGGLDGHTLLLGGLVVSALGFLFGIWTVSCGAAVHSARPRSPS
jgi:K(+)-stimulated pyrophosphate-energized sodium pump